MKYYLVSICMECGKFLREIEVPQKSLGVSHGLCTECFSILKEKREKNKE